MRWRFADDQTRTSSMMVQIPAARFSSRVLQVTSAGGGAAIPLRTRLLSRLVSSAVEGAGGVPVTVKMRMGISTDLLTFIGVRSRRRCLPQSLETAPSAIIICLPGTTQGPDPSRFSAWVFSLCHS